MDKMKGVAKGGWHPKGKDGGRESWRGDFKGINQVAGWVGHGKDPRARAHEHQSRPLAALKDPDAFGPPPKNVNYHGGAAVPNAITPDRRGLGAPLSAQEIQAREEAETRERLAAEEAARKPAPPPVPYRVNTTGLSTGNLPKPPTRRLNPESPSLASPAAPSRKPKPSLPPRLPARQDSTPVLPTLSSSPPPPYSPAASPPPVQASSVSQGAVSRLTAAGVSVPALGIGNGSSNGNAQGQAQSSAPVATSATGPSTSQLNELQSRFSKFSTNSPSPESSNQGTSMAQKQAAFNTAQAFRNDPSSVSISDARNTATTANNFRERHGDQVASGWKSASAFNKKYDVANKVNSYSSPSTTLPQAEGPQSPSNFEGSSASTIALHKRPPPPLPQKPGLTNVSTTSPPPVPLSSKPRS